MYIRPSFHPDGFHPPVSDQDIISVSNPYTRAISQPYSVTNL
jgi:hypothetical protein